MTALRIQVGSLRFAARWEPDAPRTIAALSTLLPLRAKLLHARWSGEAAWVPLGDLRLGLDYENHTSHPAPGQLLFYPGGISECEILFPYGGAMFASKLGQLAGNHFATVTEGQDALREMGRLVLWEGAQDIVVETS